MSRTWKKEIKMGEIIIKKKIYKRKEIRQKKKRKERRRHFRKFYFSWWVAWEVYIFKKKNLQKNKKISSLKKKTE